MVFGNIYSPFFEEQASLLPPPLSAALRYLRETDLMAHAPGHFELLLSGIPMILQVLDLHTAPRETLRPEVHRKYIDVQFLAGGGPEYAVFYHDDGKSVVLEDLLDTPRDILFYEQREILEGRIPMEPGSYAVFLPWDIHIPTVAVSSPVPIRKIVLKVPMDSIFPLYSRKGREAEGSGA